MKEFFIEDRHYVTIKTKGIGNSNLFAQLLNGPDKRIKLFRHEQQPSVVTGGNYAITTEHFIQIPGEEYAFGLMDMKLMPFNKKMAKVVESCPALAQKITDKEDGYKVGLVSNDITRLPIYLKIAREFDECK